MNFFNVSRATQGLVAYLHEWRAQEKIEGKPKIVIAHDSRHFSKEFTELAAKIAAENGCDACVFEGPRSTPELSFAVRHLRASAGIVITASHNPPHDNGYKVYFDDGAQVVEPHASGIIAKVNSIKSETSPARPKEQRGEVSVLGSEIDEAYMERLESLILNKELVRSAKSLRIVFTPLHGTGGVIIKPMLERLGFNFRVVEEQDRFDGNFPTVDSPNPENAAALAARRGAGGKGRRRSGHRDRSGLRSDGSRGPDRGRRDGIAYGKPDRFAPRLLPGEDAFRARRAQRGKRFARCHHQDIRHHRSAKSDRGTLRTALCRDADRLQIHRREAGQVREGAAARGAADKYRDLPEEETRRLRLEHSSYYVFGGEESYGYSGGDFVRDKDGNGAAIMFCEVAAYAKSRGLTVDALLDEIFSEFGYFQEYTGSLTFEGAEGAETIKRLLASYVSRPPKEMLGAQIIQVKNFETDTYRDIEGDEIPKEKMLIFEFGDHTRIAVRASGTEPKIKYYLFAQRRPAGGEVQRGGAGGDKARSERASETRLGLAARGRGHAGGLITGSTSRQNRRKVFLWLAKSIWMEEKLRVLKKIGLSGTQVYGKMLLDRVEGMETAELLETLIGLIDQGYVLSNKVNIRLIEDVEKAFFRVNAAYAKDLRDAVNPGRRREQERTRRQRRR